jgi:hypothetical protein
MEVVAELAVCTNCIALLSNGEVYESHEDISEAHQERVTAHYGATRDVVPGGEELGTSSRPCDLCGEESDGDRFSAAELAPVSSGSEQ